jgi:hypothetical protein
MSAEQKVPTRSSNEGMRIAPTTFSGHVTHSNHLTSLVGLAHRGSDLRGARLGRLRKAIDLSRTIACLVGFLALAGTVLGQPSVTLAWNGETNTTVAGYRLYQGASSRNYSSTTDAGTQTQVPVPGLVAGKTYYFAVTAYSSSGVESDFSSEVGYTVPSTTTNSPNGSPLISLTSPNSGAGYVAPATINLAANITANGHTINKVQFYNGSSLVGESLAAPFTFAWAGVSAGSYNLSGQVVYDGGSNAASSSVSVTVTNPAGNVPSGLVAAYGFEEGSGTTTADKSGAGNTGSLSGASWSPSGRFGKALSFNGTGAAVIVSDAASLDLTAGMTLEAWVKPSDVSNWHEVVYKGDELYYLEASTSITAGAAVGLGSSGSSPMLAAPNPLPLNTWSHLAATYDGSTLRLFVNSVQIASRAQTGPISTSSLPLTIGADTIHGSYFAGLIDEVRVYNRALTTSELQTDMNTPVSAAVASAPPTISLAAPANGASYTAPASISLSASVVTNGHTVNKIQFYNGATLLGESTTAPFVYNWTSVSAGTYAVSARLVFDGSATAVSTTNRVTVVNPPPTIVLTSPVDGSTNFAPASMTLAASVTPNGHAISSVQFYNGTNVVGTAVGAPYTVGWSNVDRGNYTLTARLNYDSTQTLYSPPASLTVVGLPLPWQSTGIGSSTNGSAWEGGGNIYLVGAGSLGSLSDSFLFVSQTLSGDGQVVAQIAAFDGTNSAANAGVMIRETLAPDAAYAFIGVNGSGNLLRARRTGTGASASFSTDSAVVLPNVWVRVSRSGDTIVRSHSTDGQAWIVDESRKIRMATSIYCGLVVNSGTSTNLSSATITNVNAIP